MVAGKVALVTGAGSGIGEATAVLFAAEGAAVAVLDRDLAAAERVAATITAAGGTATAHGVDVTDEAQVQRAVDEAVAAHGRIDIAHNNAGMTSPPSAFTDLSLDAWNIMLATNLTSVFVCMQIELRLMAAQGWGSIINTSSGAGVVAAPGLPHYKIGRAHV